MPDNPCCPPCTSPSWWTKILNALVDIATAIREFTPLPKKIGNASLHFNISGYPSLTTLGGPTLVQLFKSPLDLVITGIAVSYLGSFPTFGSSATDDKLFIQFWNFATNSPIGATLQLNVNQASDQNTNLGDAIGANLALGNIGGVKIWYVDTEAQTFTGKAFDFFIYTQPVQLQPVD